MSDKIEIIKTGKNNSDIGILSNGEPYLTTQGLGTICDVERQAVSKIAKKLINAIKDPKLSRTKQIRIILESLEEPGKMPYREITYKNVIHHCWHPDSCNAIISWFAFHSQTDAAIAYVKRIMKYGLIQGIYNHVGFKPTLEQAPSAKKLIGNDIDHGQHDWTGLPDHDGDE